MMLSLRRARAWAWAAVLALMVAFVPAAAAQQVTVRGNAAYQLTYGYDEGKLVESALDLKLRVEQRLGFDGKLHIGLDGLIPLNGGEAQFNLGEAYLDWYLDTTDWRIGRQVINWGTADGFNPTNVINPRETLSPAALTDGALEGEPVLAIQGSYYLPLGGSLTGVAVAEFVPAAGAEDMLAAIAARLSAWQGGLPVDVDRPAPVPSDGSQIEWAVRGDWLVGGHNVYVSYFRGWDDYPAAWVEFEGSVPSKVAAQYRRVQKFGLATAGTIRDAGVWTEFSYTVPDKLAVLDGPGALSSNDGYLEAVIGADYTFRNGVMVSGQVIYNGGGSLLMPYKEPGAAVKPQTYLLGIARYSPEAGHNLEGIVLANATDGGIIAAGRYTYDITQAAKLTVGLSRAIAGAGSEFHAVKSSANLVTAGVEVSF